MDDLAAQAQPLAKATADFKRRFIASVLARTGAT
jgi:hypothetical protein